MYAFSIAGGLIGILHFAAGLRRPRLSLFVAGALWLSYAVYEWFVANGTLCDDTCNIRVDLVLVLPILIVASAYARSSYLRPPGQRTVFGWVLGSAGFALLAAGFVLFGYQVVAGLAAAAAVAALVYAIKSRRGTSSSDVP
jgi:hypothetical protein